MKHKKNKEIIEFDGETDNLDELLINARTGTPNIKVTDYQEKLIEYFRKITNSIECTIQQKKIILSKFEEILNNHILRARRGEITIPKNAHLKSNAAAIIYAVIVSNNDMPKISGQKMGKIIGVTKDVIPRLYRELYKYYAQKLDFDLKGALLGRSRKTISLFFFKLLNAELGLYKLISYLEEFDLSNYILGLREIFIGTKNQLTQEEVQLFKQLSEREIKQYKDMGKYFPDIFIKYLTDLANIVKLLIISNKSHKIIGADFFCQPFVKFLMKKKIDLFMTEKVFHREIRIIYDYLINSGYSRFFPHRRKKISSGDTYWAQDTKSEHNYIVGCRIKVFLMKHIYNGKYFKNGLSVCLDCFAESKKINISFPRLRSKSFHHEDDSIKKENYSSEELCKIFNKKRGNPYFLPDLIKQMEQERLLLKCSSHHRLIHSPSFYDFKKIISWEDIPKEFPYMDIFDLPAEIIHILVIVCVDNFYKTKNKTASQKKSWIDDIIISLKKRYFIDTLYGGICPICREFNTREHLPVFDYNHLFKKKELTQDERKHRKKINDLFFLPCSEIVRRMKKKYNLGAFICCNDHMVIHETISNKIFEDKEINKKDHKDHNDTIENFHHLPKNRILIKDVLDLKKAKRRPLKKFLMAIFEISEEKEIVTTNDLMWKTNLSKSAVGYLFSVKQELLEKYGELVIGRGNTPTKFYLNKEGKQIMNLIYYFRDYYENLRFEKDNINAIMIKNLF